MDELQQAALEQAAKHAETMKHIVTYNITGICEPAGIDIVSSAESIWLRQLYDGLLQPSEVELELAKHAFARDYIFASHETRHTTQAPFFKDSSFLQGLLGDSDD